MNTTDLYLIKLNSSSIEAAHQFKEYLSPDELERKERFATLRLRECFILTRGWLRQTLARYVNLAPGQLEFIYTEQGKPFLKNHPGFQFNLAHSGDYAALAVTENEPVGIDIEKESRMQNCLAIAERFFTPTEHQALKNSKEPELLFCHIWTQKEAFLKATGEGIGFGLDQFEVSTDLSSVEVLHIRNAELAKQHWQSELLTIIPGYRIVVTRANQLTTSLKEFLQ